MPKVSVVIPAYNAMKYLPKTLDSVFQQTFCDFEVLIINDGSSDNIVEWSTRITDSRVKLISQENQGVSTARNTGIIHAKGDYVAFLDADDLWEPTKLERQVQGFQADPSAGVIYTWTLLIDETDKPMGRIFASHAEGDVWLSLLETDVTYGSSAMVQRYCFDAVGLFDRTLTSAEDLDMWLRISTHYSFAVIKEPLTLYRQYASSVSKNRQRMFQSLRIVIEKTFQAVPLEMLHHRNSAYASITLNQAWWSLDEGDLSAAKAWQMQAYLHHPKIQYSEKYVRLRLATFLIQLFGSNGYENVRSWTHFIKQTISNKAA